MIEEEFNEEENLPIEIDPQQEALMGTEGFSEPDMEEVETSIHEDEGYKKAKLREISMNLSEKKKESIQNIEVKVGGVPYAGDNGSQNRMTAIYATASGMYHKKIGGVFKQQAQNPALDDAVKRLFYGLGDIFDGVYQEIYVNYPLQWKGADGEMYGSNAEKVGEALLGAMQEVGAEINSTANKLQEESEKIEKN